MLAEQLTAIARVDDQIGVAMGQELTALFDQVILRSERLIQQQDTAGIMALGDALVLALQRPIMQAWLQGWGLGSEHAIAEMRRNVPAEMMGVQFAMRDDIAVAIAKLFELVPLPFRNLPAERAIRKRVIKLARNFSNDVLGGVRSDLMASILPQPGTGAPISRPQLLERLRTRLNIGKERAITIARTETTNAYNGGRLHTYKQSRLVTHVVFHSIHDDRRTAICTSRDGMIIPITATKAIAANTPALHFRCRSVLSPLMPAVNKSHAKIIQEPGRLWSDRTLVPLMKGWRTGG